MRPSAMHTSSSVRLVYVRLAPCADPIVIDCCWPPSLLQSVLHKVQAMPGCLLVFYADEGMPTCNDAPFTE